jgi:hypothetical protein
LVAEELEVEKSKDEQGHPIMSERICAMIIEKTQYLELINHIITGLKKDAFTPQFHKEQIMTILWSMKNICLHKNYAATSLLKIP